MLWLLLFYLNSHTHRKGCNILMAINTTEIEALLKEAMPNAGIEVLGGDGKFQVNIVSESFAGLNRVKRQQSVYRILNAHITSGAIHAVSMLLLTPEESDKQAKA